MKEFFTQLLKSIVHHFSGKPKPPQVRCAFCGEVGHVEGDCPKAAKYKMFSEREE